MVPRINAGADAGRGNSGGEEPNQQRRGAARLHDDQRSHHGDGGCHGSEFVAQRHRRVSGYRNTIQHPLFILGNLTGSTRI